MEKGIDSTTVLAIIGAVIIIAVILYILWSRGVLPFFWAANEAECRELVLKACSGDISNWGKASQKGCSKFYKGIENCENNANVEDCQQACVKVGVKVK